jgi:hypothetical protein
MIDFFVEGGVGMWPVLVLGVILVGSSGRFAWDREPVRLRFIAVLSLALLTFVAEGMLASAAKVMWAVSDPEKRLPTDARVSIFFEGLKECSRPGILGFGLLGLALIMVAVGVYRTGHRELQATRG